MSKRTLAILAAAVAAMALLTLAPAPVSSGDMPRVAALAPMSGGQLALLDWSTGLYLVSPKTQAMRRLVGSFSYRALDLAAYPEGDQILVTSGFQTKASSRSRLARYDLAGKLTGEWMSGVGYVLWTGVALEADGRTAYLVNARKPEIYRIDLTKSRSLPSLLTSVRGAEILGPAVLDARRRRLLVADPYQGVVFEVKLDRSGSAVVLRDLGEPYALALDAQADRLYIADADQGQVFAVGLGEKVLQARPLAQVKGLVEPHGLALDRDGTLWVADHRTFTLFHLAPTGALLGSFKPKLPEPAPRR